MSEAETKRHAGNPMRWRESCPDCGFILDDFKAEKRGNGPFDCPRCGAHYSGEDFFEELRQKHMAQRHNHAEADLSGEEQ